MILWVSGSGESYFVIKMATQGKSPYWSTATHKGVMKRKSNLQTSRKNN